jgi:hypothetical protein
VTRVGGDEWKSQRQKQIEINKPHNEFDRGRELLQNLFRFEDMVSTIQMMTKRILYFINEMELMLY